MKQAVIEIQGINIWYNGLQAIKDVTVSIPENSIVALIGASGSGKSTLLRSINRMLDNIPLVRVEGVLRINGEDILREDTDVIGLRRTVGMVFQNPSPFPKSIYDNIAYGLEVKGQRNSRRRSVWNFLDRVSFKAEDIVDSYDLVDGIVVRSLQEAALWDEVKDRLDRSAFRLSGGQQQRLCIARAIAVRPKILLLDEPCSGLDPISTKKIEDLLLQLKKKYTIVIVTHNMHQARRISDYTGFFHLGKLIEFDETARIFTTPREMLTTSYVQGNFG